MEMQVNPQFTGRRAGKTGSQRTAKTSAAVKCLKSNSDYANAMGFKA